MKTLTSFVAVAVALAGCGDNERQQNDAGVNRDAAAASCEPQAGTALDVVEVARGFSDPSFVTAPTGDPRLFVVEKPGRIRIIKDGELLPTPFLDLGSKVRDVGDEQGLLGLAFHPSYAENGRFFVNYTATSPQGATVIEAFTVSDDPDVANLAGEILLTEPQPFSNHNGGMIAFGPDGFLYIGMGDGGDGGDPLDHGQDATTLLGAMLRIDVDGGSPYAIPPSNPYADSSGAEKKEIWAIGLRNPWRWSHDSETGDLYIADVGQNEREEVNVQPASSLGGENYGWNIMEGTACFKADTCDQSGLTLPVHDYDRTGDDRCAVTGGYVYRGSCLPDVQGRYFFADYCTGQVWTLEYEGGTADNVQEITSDLDPEGVLDQISSFGVDGRGELYIVSLNGGIYRIVGERP